MAMISGTGHGVGAALNVHEGPQRISPLLDNTALDAGMVVSNEPGYYENDAFGIRIENLLLVVPAALPAFGGKEFLRFEPLTLVPIQTKMIEVALLTDAERRYLNDYHERVRKELLELLPGEKVKKWLIRATEPV